jgi:hypothetical protein
MCSSLIDISAFLQLLLGDERVSDQLFLGTHRRIGSINAAYIVANREDLAARLWRKNPQSKNQLVDRKTREVHSCWYVVARLSSP